MNSPTLCMAGHGPLDGQRIPIDSLRRLGVSMMAAIIGIAVSATAYAAIAQPESTKVSPRQCADARKALGKEERALTDTESRIARAKKLLESCGSKPMCDGYQQELSMLEARKPKLETRIDQRKAAVDRACAEPPASDAAHAARVAATRWPERQWCPP